MFNKKILNILEKESEDIFFYKSGIINKKLFELMNLAISDIERIELAKKFSNEEDFE